MIFFVFGIFVVPLYYRNNAFGWAVTCVLTAASLFITAYLVWVHDLAPYALDYHYEEYSYWAYSKPYTRIPAYFVGIVAAWILLRMEKSGITEQTGMCGPVTATLLWIFAVVVLIFLTFIPATDHGLHANSWSKVSNLLFLTLSRPLWAVCWAVITFLCYYGHAPITNTLLSHRFWTPFARLTYGAYLCHPLVIKLAAGCAVQFYIFSGMDMVYRSLGNIICAYSCSFVVWCMLERPMMTFTTAMIKSWKGSKTSAEKTEGLRETDVERIKITEPSGCK